MDFVEWLESVNWWDVIKDVLLPALGILIPTSIAIYLARNERVAAERSHAIERRLAAGSEILRVLSRMVTMNGVAEPMRDTLRDLRGSVAVFRASSGKEVLAGDWLALQYQQGVWLWSVAMHTIDESGGPGALGDDELDSIMSPPRTWAQTTLETFSGWLSGNLGDQVLVKQGADIVARLGVPKTLADITLS
ncbi:hypothetical protein [Agromyces sp. ZXT2-3]|uniref:hypothetical protein n=1 Tax=Agromyces sp. ZXT2-3 TaxID=3461152 RepID=UPI00405516C6